MNRPSPLPGSEQSIPHRFEETARTYPGKIALVSGKESISYAELNLKASHLAVALRSLGARPGTRVALLLPDDLPLVVGWLGVFKSGAMCVPLLAEHPARQLQSILLSAKPLCLVTTSALRKQAEQIAPQIPVLAIENLPSTRAGCEPSPPFPLQQEAYILYTSGTTGKPKGVVQTHRNLIHNVEHLGGMMRITPEDRLVALSSMGMGQGVATLFIALLHGASLYPFPLKERGFEALVHWLAEHKISIYTSSVSVFRRLAESLPKPFSLPHLRVIRLGTEELQKTDVDLFKRQFSPETVLFNCLGSTETMNYASFEIHHDTVISGNAVPVGIPPADTDLELIPDNPGENDTAGEILVRSEFLSPGYWEDPVLTGEKFLLSADGKRSYRTGDRGLRREDGSLIFAGRVDGQVKVRGNRVEPARIESKLHQHPEVKEAAVSLRSGSDAPLIAHVVTKLSPAELRIFLSEELPEFMIPSDFIFMESLPLTPSGKVDRRALQEIQPEYPIQDSILQPQNETESALADCWAAVLGRTGFGSEDDFFTIGGDSIKALQLFTGIRSRLGVRFHFADFPHGFSIRQMAEAIPKKSPSTVPEEKLRGSFLVRLKNGGTQNPLFLIPGGYGGDTEIQLLEAVAEALPTKRPVLGIRSGARIPEGPLAGSLASHAKEVMNEIRTMGFIGTWNLVGECLSSPVTLALASAAEAEGIPRGPVILIEPWIPSPQKKGILSKVISLGNTAFSRKRSKLKRLPKVAAYYDLVKSSPPPQIGSDLHLILTTRHPFPERVEDYCRPLTRGQLFIHRIEADHHTLIRENSGKTASLLCSILSAH